MYVSGKYYEDGTKQTDRITDGGSGNLAQTNTNRIVNGDNIGNLTNWIDTTITDLRYSYQKESFYLEWQDLS